MLNTDMHQTKEHEKARLSHAEHKHAPNNQMEGKNIQDRCATAAAIGGGWHSWGSSSSLQL